MPLPRGGSRLALIRSDPTHPSEVEILDVPAGGAASPAAAGRAVTALNTEAIADIDLVEPQERWHEVDGRQIQGWYFAPLGAGASGGGARRTGPPLVLQIHGGPHSLYGWTPVWEFQVLAGAGIGVYASNPRGSEGYGQAFTAANFRDWADGPTRDVLAGVDALVAEGLADPDRLGVTGGSYGGYLTNWIVAHDQRFRAALTARSVCDMAMLMLTGDISGAEFGRPGVRRRALGGPRLLPRDLAPDVRREHPDAAADPALRAGHPHDRRPGRGAVHGAPLAPPAGATHARARGEPRADALRARRSGASRTWSRSRDWFAHFLVRGRRGMPPVPRSGRRGSARSA